MNKEKAERMYEQKGIVHIPQYKKLWYSITKFEKYPEMATEGVGRAILYLVWLMTIFAIIVAVGLVYKFNGLAKSGINYIDKNINEITYKNGELSIDLLDSNVKTNIGNVIVDTRDLTGEERQKYESNSNSNQLEIIWLKEKVIVKMGQNVNNYYYKTILDEFGITEFNKSSLVNYLSEKMSSPQIYISYAIAMIIYVFIAYFISTLMDVLFLSIFGLLTALIAKIKMRYRAVFNMSVYAITLSTVLQLIYVFINLFTDFNIKYFDLMYTAIAYICLTAAIFMIKSDVIKQQLELMKIIEIKKQEEQNKEEEKDKDDKKEDDDKEEDEKKKEDKEKDKGLNDEVEGQGQGSNA